MTKKSVHKAENYKRIGATTQDLLSAGLDLETVPLLHLLKGCDSTSYIYGIGNSTAWSIFKSSHELLKNINSDVPNNIDYEWIEKFKYLANIILEIGGKRSSSYQNDYKPILS